MLFITRSIVDVLHSIGSYSDHMLSLSFSISRSLSSLITHLEEATIDGEEVELGYPITCGESKAVLLFKKFVCPGINVKCVKVSKCVLYSYIIYHCEREIDVPFVKAGFGYQGDIIPPFKTDKVQYTR